jgi:hypothetical protein
VTCPSAKSKTRKKNKDEKVCSQDSFFWPAAPARDKRAHIKAVVYQTYTVPSHADVKEVGACCLPKRKDREVSSGNYNDIDALYSM